MASQSQLSQDLLSLYQLVGLLKKTKRTGWVCSNVALPESIADHMYRMSLMAMTAPQAGVNNTHAMELALVHDLAEAIVGDITPLDGVSKEDKHRLESDAMLKITRDHFAADHKTGQKILSLWAEYEVGETLDAKFVKQLDKLEMLIQADEYERDQNLDLSDFFSSNEGIFSFPVLNEIDASIREARKARRS